MREALELVKRELGSDAVILGTRTLPPAGLGALAKRQRVEITAAPPSLSTPAPRLKDPGTKAPAVVSAVTTSTAPAPEPPPAPATPDPPALPPHLYPYYVQLVQNEVANDLATQLVKQAVARVPAGGRDEAALRDALREYIAGLIPASSGVDLQSGGPRRVALVGPSGGGKTTTLAKLAAHFKLRQGKRVALLSLDASRMAAHEQLRRYAEVIDVPVYAAQTITEVRQGLRELESPDLLLIDTPGIGLREQGRFARVAALLRAVRPDETHLVLPASLTPAVQARVAQGFAPLGLTRVVLTRLDDAIGFGVILNVTQRLNLSVSYVTTGQNVPNDIEEASGRRVAESLVPLRT
jgi:flagellar biosynthesis protein FlhF